MANRGKMRQIADVIRSKIVVEIGVFYYRLPFVSDGGIELVDILEFDYFCVEYLLFSRKPLL